MTDSVSDGISRAPRIIMLLPIAFLLHLMEEWFADFSAWTLVALGTEVSSVRFVLINTIAFVVFGIGTMAAIRYPRMAWFGVSFAALLGLNGMLHTIASVGLGQYSPGTVTGLLLYIPLSALVLKSFATRLSVAVFVKSVLFGVALHGLVAFMAFF
ncbi:MAG: HXXEE domain-containing protein [Saprospiraceae bacterium]|nr:HXXEE domain-containing protein [Saprospiraceae bacterium]